MIGPIHNKLRNLLCLLTDYMGETASNINSDQYYGGGIYYFISSDEVGLTLCEPYEGD